MQFSLQSSRPAQSGHRAHSTRMSRIALKVVAGLRRAAPVALPALMLALPTLSFAQAAGLPAFNTSPGPNGGTTYSLSVQTMLLLTMLSFLPAMAVEAGLTDRTAITVRPLAAAHPSREIVVAWRAGSSRGVEGRLLAETLRDAT